MFGVLRWIHFVSDREVSNDIYILFNSKPDFTLFTIFNGHGYSAGGKLNIYLNMAIQRGNAAAVVGTLAEGNALQD